MKQNQFVEIYAFPHTNKAAEREIKQTIPFTIVSN